MVKMANQNLSRWPLCGLLWLLEIWTSGSALLWARGLCGAPGVITSSDLRREPGESFKGKDVVWAQEESEKDLIQFLYYADFLHRREETGCSQLELSRGIKAKTKSFALEGLQGKQYVTSMDKVAVGVFWGVESCTVTHTMQGQYCLKNNIRKNIFEYRCSRIGTNEEKNN